MFSTKNFLIPIVSFGRYEFKLYETPDNFFISFDYSARCPWTVFYKSVLIT